MYFNKEAYEKLIEKKLRVIDEKHEKINLDLEPGEAGIVTIVKSPGSYALLIDHWGATFNPNTLYMMKVNNFTEYISDEPPQEDMDHETLYQYKFANFVSFVIINFDNVTHNYKLDFYVKEVILPE